MLESSLRENPYVLAPMAGITDRPFRSLMREMGCGAVISELVSATGLEYNSAKTKRIMEFSEDQRPVGIQLFGENLQHLHKAAQFVEQSGADFVDINFGCPVSKVVKKGAGSAFLKDLVALRDVLRAVKSAVSIPVTIKVRTGWDESSRNSLEVSQVAYDEGIFWMGVHGRTRAQAYSGEADWGYIREVAVQSPIPILGNGDITNGEMARKKLEDSRCSGVMIGRGCLKNPWIFKEAHGEEVSRDFKFLFSRMRYHMEQNFDERVLMLQTKKLACWYTSGYPDSGLFRKNIFQTKNISEMDCAIEEYFGSLSESRQKDTSKEKFLMGGHG